MLTAMLILVGLTTLALAVAGSVALVVATLHYRQDGTASRQHMGGETFLAECVLFVLGRETGNRLFDWLCK